ncbi:MAG: alpha/beta hydrolase [Sandaracinaceae bacterium]
MAFGSKHQPVERTLTANGLKHHVLSWNDAAGTTIVCCHGFLDQAWSFQGVAQPLADAGFRVVAFDWRGHGETEHVGRGGYYHFLDYVLDLHALMPFLASGDVHVVGHSMGGTAVSLYAATHPGGAESVTLVEGLGPPAFDGEAPDKARTWLDSMDRFWRREPKLLTDLADAVRRLRMANPAMPTDIAYFLAEKGTVEVDGGLTWRFDPLHRTTSPSPFDPAEFGSFLARIEAPTLVVSGERGFRTADHEARVAALPNAKEIVLPDVGHMIHWLQPEALAEAILSHVG